MSLTRNATRSIAAAAILLCCIALLDPNAAAQTASATAAPPALRQDLQRIGAEANQLLGSMPSFTCDETALSQAIRDGKVVRTMNLSGIVRAVRQKDGSIHETNDIQRQHILLVLPKLPPLFVTGGFATALSYFLPSVQACYRYSLSRSTPHRIDFAASPNPNTASQCKDHGLEGYALLDAQGNVSHLERRLPDDIARPLKLATFASIDLAPVELSGQTYQLAHHMIAEMPLGNPTGRSEATGHFEATYTNCHRFAATVTLGPSAEVPPPPLHRP